MPVILHFGANPATDNVFRSICESNISEFQSLLIFLRSILKSVGSLEKKMVKIFFVDSIVIAVKYHLNKFYKNIRYNNENIKKYSFYFPVPKSVKMY